MKPCRQTLASHAAALLDGKLTEAVPLSGGDLSEIWAIGLQDGRRAVVKSGPIPRVEAAMLRALRHAGAPAPDVLAVDDTALVLERIQTDDSLSHADQPYAWESLGHVLRQLHCAPVAMTGRYGWETDFAFGSLPIINDWHDNWGDFWRDNRLLPHVPHVPPPLAHRLEQLAAVLPDRLPARPRAALLHGDLWRGNILMAGKCVTGLIDPACCFAPAECDFAMLTLFSRPDVAFWNAYGPLDPGWSERVAIYQLWPALVHLRLFGRRYHGMVSSLLDAIPL